MASDRVVQFAAFGALVAVAAAGVTVTNRSVPRTIERATESALNEAGIDDVSVVADDRNVRLSGPPDLQAPALAISRKVRGVLTATYDVRAVAVDPFGITASVRNRNIRLGGQLPDVVTKSSVATCASASFGVDHIVDQSSVVDKVGARDFSGRVAPICAVLAVLAVDANRAELKVPANGVDLTAEAFTVPAAERIKAAAAALGVPAEVSVTVVKQDVQTSFTELLGRSGINFAENSAVIDAPSQVVLDTAVEILRSAPTAAVEVGGHADDRGDDATNLILSQARADSVLAYLVAKGIAPEQLTAVGYGETRPIADNTTAQGLRANRRIEFIVTKGA